MNGKFIVLEGTDGSGKGTQLGLLVEYLKTKAIPFATVDFPRYTESFFGELAGDMLLGELGPIENIPPKLAVLPFACDRWLIKNDMDTWLSEGKLVIANRYTASSAVYHAARLEESNQDAFIDWIYTLEQEVIGIPKETLTIFLRTPLSLSQELLKQREYKEGKRVDMYEKDTHMLAVVEKLYDKLRQTRPNWKTIECSQKGKMRSPQEIHKEIVTLLAKSGIWPNV